MKKLFITLLLLVVNATFGNHVFAQEPADLDYVQQKENADHHRRQTLAEAYKLVEFRDGIYTNHDAYIIYKKFKIFALDRVYKSSDNSRPFNFKGESDYIVFYNLDTKAFDVVIDLKPIFSKIEYRQIGHHNGETSISIDSISNTLYFSTATHIFAYELSTGKHKLIEPKENTEKRRFNLTGLSARVLNNKLILKSAFKMSYGWTTREPFAEYDLLTGKVTRTGLSEADINPELIWKGVDKYAEEAATNPERLKLPESARKTAKVVSFTGVHTPTHTQIPQEEGFGELKAMFAQQRDSKTYIRFLFNYSTHQWMMELSTNQRDWSPEPSDLNDGEQIIERVWAFDTFWLDGKEDNSSVFGITEIYVGLQGKIYRYSSSMGQPQLIENLPKIKNERVILKGESAEFTNINGIIKIERPLKQKPIPKSIADSPSMIQPFVNEFAEQFVMKAPFTRHAFLVGNKYGYEPTTGEIYEYYNGEIRKIQQELKDILKTREGLKFECTAIDVSYNHHSYNGIDYRNTIESVSKIGSYLYYYVGRSSYDESVHLVFRNMEKGGKLIGTTSYPFIELAGVSTHSSTNIGLETVRRLANDNILIVIGIEAGTRLDSHATEDEKALTKYFNETSWSKSPTRYKFFILNSDATRILRTRTYAVPLPIRFLVDETGIYVTCKSRTAPVSWTYNNLAKIQQMQVEVGNTKNSRGKGAGILLSKFDNDLNFLFSTQLVDNKDRFMEPDILRSIFVADGKFYLHTTTYQYVANKSYGAVYIVDKNRGGQPQAHYGADNIELMGSLNGQIVEYGISKTINGKRYQRYSDDPVAIRPVNIPSEFPEQ